MLRRDLLQLFDLPSPWSESSKHMECYFGEFRSEFADRDWTYIRGMLEGYLKEVDAEPSLVDDMTRALGLVAAKSITEFHKRPYTRGTTRNLSTEQESWWDAWLRANTPVRDRVFRTTRTTLRTYQEQGVLPEGTVVPKRRVTHESCELGDSAEALYRRIDSYIQHHYNAYLTDRGRRRPLGFIMTVYRRRLTSSFHAVRCSLEKRREVLGGRLQAAADWEEMAAASAEAHLAEEFAELDSFIDELNDLPPDEPKTQRLYELLVSSFADGHRSVVVFTQYADTLRYLRERLRVIYGTGIVCYYGGRSERWDPDVGDWGAIPKERVKELFRRGEDVRIMLATDSMSEGLNLQTCARVINYDLPWNFMRVEQRIGRIGRVDRIGGQPLVEVTNLSYTGTVEDDILRRIEERLKWFTTVVGSAQPVLASMESAMQRAALGQITPDLAIHEIEQMDRQAKDSRVRLEDLDAVPQHTQPLRPSMDLIGLRDSLLAIRACAERLSPHPNIEGAWLLHLDGSLHDITFDRNQVLQHDGLSLLTWGSPLLDRLLHTAQRGANNQVS